MQNSGGRLPAASRGRLLRPPPALRGGLPRSANRPRTRPGNEPPRLCMLSFGFWRERSISRLFRVRAQRSAPRQSSAWRPCRRSGRVMGPVTPDPDKSPQGLELPPNPGRFRLNKPDELRSSRPQAEARPPALFPAGCLNRADARRARCGRGCRSLLSGRLALHGVTCFAGKLMRGIARRLTHLPRRLGQC